MIELTQSLRQWLWDNHRDIIGLIMFGHLELFTEDMKKEYLEWCQTEEGKQYLKSGSKYIEEGEANETSKEETDQSGEKEST